jgi:3-oxoacyl-[acyl-carrier-protein] synthase II
MRPQTATNLPARAAQRVVITGAGIVTALGIGWRANAEGFRAGRRAFRPVTLFDFSRQRAKEAAEVDLPGSLPETRLSARTIRRLNRASRQLLWAATEAWRQAGWTPDDNLPQVWGTTSCGMECGEDYYRHALAARAPQPRQPTRSLGYQGQRQALNVAEGLGFRGPITLLANACASGANAIGHAWELIRSGGVQRVLTGGYDALSQLVFAGFDSLQALSSTTCRPFDAQRDGLALGEGAAALTLESLDSARRRDAGILGEIVGYGAATDVHHLTQPHPDGIAAWQAMQEACTRAAVTPEEVGYVNAHGTGTPLNDAAEARAIQRWAGSHVATLPVSSTKGSVGHLLGAAGAVEAVVCLMVLREQWLPPEPFVENPDPACVFPLVREPRDARVDVAMSNSFGFGGANATLVFRRWA